MIAAQPARPAPKAIINTPSVETKRRRARTTAVSSKSLQRAGAAIAVAASLLLTAYIGEYATVAQLSRERSELRSALRHERQENSNLHAAVAALERPQRIDHMARAMAMEQRNDADYVKLAPLPTPRVPAEKNRPILAGFLPEWLVRGRDGAR